MTTKTFEFENTDDLFEQIEKQQKSDTIFGALIVLAGLATVATMLIVTL